MRLLPTLLLAACAGAPDPGDDTDTVDSDDSDDSDVVDHTGDTGDTDAADTDPPGPPTYTVRLIAPPAPHVFGGALGITPQGDLVGYAGDEAWSVLAVPMVAPLGDDPALLPTSDDPEAEPRRAFVWAGHGDDLVGEADSKPAAWAEGALTWLPIPDGYNSGSARDVDADGLVVGSWADADFAFPTGPRPCAWVDRTRACTPLAPLVEGGVLGVATGVHAQGGLVGWSDVEGIPRAARWADPDATPVDLGAPEEAVLSEALDVDAHGHAVGRYTLADFTSVGFSTHPGAFADLPDLGGGYAEAWAISDDHLVVGASSLAQGGAHAVLWWDGEAHDLNDLVDTLPDGVRHLAIAKGIDAEGRIAVEAVMDDDDRVRWPAVLEPVAAARASR